MSDCPPEEPKRVMRRAAASNPTWHSGARADTTLLEQIKSHMPARSSK